MFDTALCTETSHAMLVQTTVVSKTSASQAESTYQVSNTFSVCVTSTAGAVGRSVHLGHKTILAYTAQRTAHPPRPTAPPKPCFLLLTPLQNHAILLRLLLPRPMTPLSRRRQHSTYRLVKHRLQSLLPAVSGARPIMHRPGLDSRLGARLEILDRAYVPRARRAHRVRDGREAALFQPLERDGVFAQVELGPDEYEGRVWRVVHYLGDPLGVSAATVWMGSGGRNGVVRGTEIATVWICMCGSLPVNKARAKGARAGPGAHFLHRQLLDRASAGSSRTVRMFSNDGGETTEKHTKNTSVWGYDNGRNRLGGRERGSAQSDAGYRSLVVLLSGRIPQTQADGPAVDKHRRRVVVEDCVASVKLLTDRPGAS